jgi:hypothetical protein
MTQRQRKSKAKVKRARHKRARVEEFVIGTRVHKAIEEHPQVSLYDLLDAYADVIKRKVGNGKSSRLAAKRGKRKSGAAT